MGNRKRFNPKGRAQDERMIERLYKGSGKGMVTDTFRVPDGSFGELWNARDHKSEGRGRQGSFLHTVADLGLTPDLITGDLATAFATGPLSELTDGDIFQVYSYKDYSGSDLYAAKQGQKSYLTPKVAAYDLFKVISTGADGGAAGKKLLQQPDFAIGNYALLQDISVAGDSQTLVQDVSAFQVTSKVFNAGVDVTGNKHITKYKALTAPVTRMTFINPSTGAGVEIATQWAYDPNPSNNYFTRIVLNYYPTSWAADKQEHIIFSMPGRWLSDVFGFEYEIEFLATDSLSVAVKMYNTVTSEIYYDGTSIISIPLANWSGGYYIYNKGSAGAGQIAYTEDTAINNTYGTLIYAPEIEYLGNIAQPTKDNFYPSADYAITASKSGTTVTMTGAPTLDESLVGTYINWGYKTDGAGGWSEDFDGYRDYIVSVDSTTEVTVSYAGGVVDDTLYTNCFIQGPIYASYYHQQLEKVVIQAEDRLYESNAPLDGWKEIPGIYNSKIITEAPLLIQEERPLEAEGVFHEVKHDLLLSNYNGHYRIVFGENGPHYFKINEAKPNAKPINAPVKVWGFKDSETDDSIEIVGFPGFNSTGDRAGNEYYYNGIIL